MKTLVTYYSESGNTEKLAKAIYEGLEATENEIAPISEEKILQTMTLFLSASRFMAAVCL